MSIRDKFNIIYWKIRYSRINYPLIFCIINNNCPTSILCQNSHGKSLPIW